MTDIDDLKAASENSVAAANRRDLDALSDFWHDQMVLFNADAPFPAIGKVAVREGWQALFTNSESSNLTLINPQYFVVENTGVSCGHYMTAVKPIDGPLHTEFGRYSATYVKVAGKWHMLTLDASRLPSGG